MHAILHFFIRMCLLKETPDRTPSSNFLIGLLVLIAIGLQYWVLIENKILDIPTRLAFGWAVVLTALFGVTIWGMLRLANKEARFIKTFTSLLACDLLLTLPRLFIAAFYLSHQEVGEIGLIGSLLAGVSFGLQIYELIVAGFILQHALDTTLGIGCMLVIAAIFLTLVGSIILLPFPLDALPEI